MTPACRHCRAPLEHTFCDLGMSPLSNAYLKPEHLGQAEKFYPLHARVCGRCFLVQIEQFEDPALIFGDYAYFSSYSDTWLEHARAYVETMVERFGLGRESQVVEIASNDGYLLRYFVERGIPVLGVEPAGNVAEVARQAGIPTLTRFFGQPLARELAAEGRQADLLLGNNVLAHVPDLNDFVGGLKLALKPSGVITMEFPHLLRLIQGNQFDTIYHEHFSYFSLLTVRKVFRAAGLRLFDVEELPTHGGSLRIFATHEENATFGESARLTDLEKAERAAGLEGLAAYSGFSERVKETKRALLGFLVDAKRAGKAIAGYGAPAKGNTLLNYCGVRTDFLDYTVDRSPHKQGLYLPGTHIPVYAPERIFETRPDYVLVLPWNLEDEIVAQMARVRDWGGQFLSPIPSVRVLR